MESSNWFDNFLATLGSSLEKYFTISNIRKVNKIV